MGNTPVYNRARKGNLSGDIASVQSEGPRAPPRQELLGSDSRRKRGGGPLTDLWSAAINLGEIPELQWTQLQGGLMKASRGALAAATKHVYLCQSVPAFRLRAGLCKSGFIFHMFIYFLSLFFVHVSLNRIGNLSPRTCRKW